MDQLKGNLPSLAVNSLDYYLLYSYLGSHGHYTNFVLGGLQYKVRLMSGPTRTLVSSHAAHWGRVWKNSRFQCMCESSLTLLFQGSSCNLLCLKTSTAFSPPCPNVITLQMPREHGKLYSLKAATKLSNG